MAHFGVRHLFPAILGLREMRSIDNSAAKGTIMTELEHLFETLSSGPRQVRFCETCGSQMVEVDTPFVLLEGERSWTVPVPICQKCLRDSKRPHFEVEM
jgi:hypothetical protein